MGLQITGVDWDSFHKEENKPIVFGIEELMISVSIISRLKVDGGWQVEMIVFRIITCSRKFNERILPSGSKLRGILFEEGKEQGKHNYGLLEVEPVPAA